MIVIIALVYISSVVKQSKLAKATSVAAGVAMIIAGVSFVYWIIKTPVKKDNDQIV